jgi:hypothetical protein
MYNVSSISVYCNVPSAKQHYQRYDEILVRFQGRTYDAVVVEQGTEHAVRHFTKHCRYNHSMLVQVAGVYVHILTSGQYFNHKIFVPMADVIV